MENSLKRTLFARGRQKMAEAGIATKTHDSLVCPLCWEETRFEDLSIEHIVPGSVGGYRRTLTCRHCNNDHGSDLDAHLKNFQRTKDAFKGHGTLPVEMNVNGNRIVANLAWNEEAKNFNIVGKATEKRSLDAMQDDFRNNRVSEFSFTLNYRYAEDNFHRAVLRAAYLVLFEHLGYSYAQQDIVQSLRQRISDGALSKPDLGSIIIGLEAAKLPNNQDYLVVQSRLKGREFFLVIIRAQGFSTSYVGAFFPSESGSISDFVSLLDRLRESNNGGKMTISLPDQSSTSC